jgi:dienelactone hydrolase
MASPHLLSIVLITAAALSGQSDNSPPTGTGPFPAVMESDPGLPTHTVYRPRDLGTLGNQKLPVIAWGNGACVNIGNRFRWFLTEIASHGYVIIALGPIGPANFESSPMTNPPLPRPGQTTPTVDLSAPPDTRSEQLIDAVNWAIGENGRPSSRYYRKLDTRNIAIMGQSCGGVQAIAASADSRVKLTVAWNSGLVPTPSMGMEDISKDALKKLHAPIAYITGDQANDVAFPNAADDFERINNVPVFRAWRDGLPHIGTYRDPNGGELGKIAVALLDWKLKGDAPGGKMFSGKDCGLCKDPRWHVSSKRFDEQSSMK